jgi:hypothetical protein
MALDLNAIKNKLNQLSGKARSASSLWKPPLGKSVVRLLPLNTANGTPFEERYFYYNIGNNPGILAPHQFGKPDPVQELINKLHEEGTPTARETAKKLYPKMRAYAGVIVRGEEDKGVRWWGFGKMVYQSLLNILLDADYGDISDPLEGHDLTVTMQKLPNRSFPTTEVMPKPKATQLASTPDTIKEYIDGVPDLNDIYKLKSYDEIEKIVNDWLNGASDNDGTEHTQALKQPTSEEGNTSGKTYDDLDSAFSDLLS